ncbi:hypothetical protein PNOK_0424100 [Pyrrhoderma noxium]|uniref:Uncharacterized protein n=1 Tax=Pyrrhoderma noxium TaxID=2282107 RepID=A0A286UI98_9AGAM|nr:hypothetical protein PNOK_0424100 [Pyrrhoderma noxium]
MLTSNRDNNLMQIIQVSAKLERFCMRHTTLHPILYILSCIAPLCFEVVLLLLVLHKAYTLRNTLSDKYHKPMSLVWVIIQDQILFFAWILSCFLLHFVELKTENAPIVQIAGVILHAPPLPCVIGCYTMMHLKESGKQDSFLSFSSMELEGELSQIRFS